MMVRILIGYGLCLLSPGNGGYVTSSSIGAMNGSEGYIHSGTRRKR